VGIIGVPTERGYGFEVRYGLTECANLASSCSPQWSSIDLVDPNVERAKLDSEVLDDALERSLRDPHPAVRRPDAMWGEGQRDNRSPG
jgi:hypothetical protein